MRLAVVQGKLTEGDEMPSVRDLSEQLSINSNTVHKAYAELVRTNWLTSRRGRVPTATEPAPIPVRQRETFLDEAAEELIHAGIAAGATPEEMQRAFALASRRLGVPVSA